MNKKTVIICSLIVLLFGVAGGTVDAAEVQGCLADARFD